LLICALPLSARASGQAPGDPAPENYVNTTVTIQTNLGTIVAMLYDYGAPITVNNFVNLSVGGFYDGILFHRIVDDFVIQTGDPNTKDSNPYNDGMGGSSETIPLEVSENLPHIDGALGMARSSDPNSASSQFYICDGEQHGLDMNYAVFGVVIEGMDVVREIASQEVYGMRRPLLQEHPVNDIVMESVTVTYGYQAEPPAPPGGGGLGGLFGGLSPGSGTDAELGISILAVLAVAAVGVFAIAGVRRGVKSSLKTYKSDAKRIARASRRMAGKLARGARGALPTWRRPV
jgi:cyclophilin family peptidyl-prolyl cis-trans isomerase